MSDVEVLSPTTPNRVDDLEAEPQIDEHESIANGGDQLETQEKTSQEEDEKEKRPAEEDRTEDQVPDITGTENADLMATSMEEIEELPASEEAQAAESTELLDASPQMGEETVEDVAAATAVEQEVVEGAVVEEEKAIADVEAPQEADIQQSLGEPEPAAKEEAIEEIETQIIETEAEPPMETPTAGEEEPKPEAEPTETTQEAEEIIEETKEEVFEEPTKPEEQVEEQQPPLEANAEEEQNKVEEEHTKDEGVFELQAPPTPKRPRTPNELDNVIQAEEEQVSQEVLEEPQPTQEVPVQEEVPQPHVKEIAEEIKAEMQPPETPTQSVDETPKEPGAPLSRKISGSAASKTAGESIPSTPKSASLRTPIRTPKDSQNVAASPRSPLKKQDETKTPDVQITPTKKAFDFEQPPETPKSVTVDESAASPKTPRSARTPKTPRTPRTPATPKTPKAIKTEVEEPTETVPEKETVREEIQEVIETEKEVAQPTAETDQVLENVKENVEADQAQPETTEETKEVLAAEQQVETEIENKEEVAESAEEIKQPSPPAPKEVVEEEFVRVEAPVLGEECDGKSHEKLEAVEQIDEVPQPPKKESRQEIPERYTAVQQSRPARSPSPERRQRAALPRESSFTHYDQDSFRSKGAPPRLPTNASFSSYTPVEKPAYSSISPWVQNAINKYHTDYTGISPYRSPSLYLSQFDDMVSTGAFSNSLYSTNRLLERSRSRTRERKRAMRSARSASNYYRYTSAYGTAPIRTREYSTPPTSAITRQPSRSGSFISFLQYSDAKQYELARSRSRSYGFETPYSHSAYDQKFSQSRTNIEPFYGSGRLSRVDSYVNEMNRRYESSVPSTYAKYRSSSRSNIPQSYVPSETYALYHSPSGVYKDTHWYERRSPLDNGAAVRSIYENRIGDLERNLSHERLAMDRATQPVYSPYSSIRSPSSNTLSRLYSGFTRDWIGV